MYQTYGFNKVYEFLLPFFTKNKINAKISYKNILFMYSNNKKLALEYKVIKTSGLEHEKRFLVEVIVGGKKEIGEAIGKKAAEEKAAKAFIEKYHISNVIKDKNRSKGLFFRDINAQRKRDLNSAVDILGIKRNILSYNQLDEIMMHSSYANEHLGKGYHSNACISIVGANLFTMFCFEYILKNYNMEKTVNVKEKGVLLQEDNLSKSISDKGLEYILKSSKINNPKERIRLKVDVLKSIVGMLMVNSVLKKDSNISRIAKDYAFNALAKSAKDKILDYRTCLQEVIQKYRWSITEEFEYKGINEDNSTMYIAKIGVHGSGWDEIGIGAGGSVLASKNVASKDALQKLLPRRSNDPAVESVILRMMDPELLCEYQLNKKGISLRYDNVNINRHSDGNIIKKNQNGNIKSKLSNEISFDGYDNVLYIFKGGISCKKKSHIIMPRIGIFASLGGKSIKINIEYCSNCHHYYMSYNEYVYYRDFYGALLGNIEIIEDANYYDSRFYGLADESILHICGYTVSQSMNLSESYRRKILGNIMDRRILDKSRVIEYLKFFINNSKFRSNMKIAVQKWTEDLTWVVNYKIDIYKKYIINN